MCLSMCKGRAFQEEAAGAQVGKHEACRELQVHRGLCTELRVDTSPVGDWETVKGFKEWGGG